LRGIDGEEADAPNDRRPSRAAYASWLGHATLRGMVNVLLTVAFLASATIAISHVINRAFIAPLRLRPQPARLRLSGDRGGLLDAWPALVVSLVGIACWLLLTGRTARTRVTAHE
jgi:hypothetical protein